MFKLKGIKWVFVLAIITCVANAGIFIDGQEISGEEIRSIEIEPISGNIKVLTKSGYIIMPEPTGSGVAMTFTVADSTVTGGDLITFAWVTDNAESCSASGGVDGWNQTVIGPGEVADGSESLTAATVGSHDFTLTCVGSDPADTLTRKVSVDIASPFRAVITSLTADNATVRIGDTVTLSWETELASECRGINGTGNWSSETFTAGSGLPNGFFEVVMDEINSFKFVLECTGEDGVAVTDSQTITVTGVNTTNTCDTPPKLSVDTTVKWSDFWQYEFPEPRSAHSTIRIPRSGYYAFEFEVPLSGDIAGGIRSIEDTNTAGARTGSISQCKGDFSTVPDECSYVWGTGGGIKWTTNPDDSGSCLLEKGQKYYFNISFTDGKDAATTSCGLAPCYTDVRVIKY